VRGRMELTLTAADGTTVAVRQADNSVMRGGADLVARLFTGTGAPITHMGVGTSDTAETDGFATTALANEGEAGAEPLTGGTEAPIPTEAFTITTDETRRVVLVRVRATLPPAAAVGTVREAGLLSRSEGAEPVLYNRVTFAPIAKGSDHELTLFWEVTFPYGDLQWLL
jgi:hypothetical protein